MGALDRLGWDECETGEKEMVSVILVYAVSPIAVTSTVALPVFTAELMYATRTAC